MDLTSDQTNVSLSNKKIVNIIVNSLIFLAYGFWLIFKPEISKFYNPHRKVELAIGIICIISGVIVTYYSLKKLKSKTPGLILNSDGIQKNFRTTYSGLIPWSDINRVRVVKYFGQKEIFLEVSNPKTYIKKQKNIFNKISMFLDYRIYDSPLKINPDGLDISFEELHQLITKKFNLYKPE